MPYLVASLALHWLAPFSASILHPACGCGQWVWPVLAAVIRITSVDLVAEPGHQEVLARDAFPSALPPLALKSWRMGSDWAGRSEIGSILRFTYLLFPGRGKALPPQGGPVGGTVAGSLNGPWQGLPQGKE